MSDSIYDLHRIAGESIAVLRYRYLVLTDQNHCAAMILDTFFAHAERQFIDSQYSVEDEEYDPRYKASVKHIQSVMFNLFTAKQVIEGLNLLLNKGFATITEKEGDIYTFYVHRDRVITASQSYWNEAERKRQEYYAQFKSEEPDAPIAPEIAPLSPEEEEMQKRERILSRETDRVKSHNTRATRVSLPATLTLEEWLETLEYFGWKCAYCGGEYNLLEHYIPLSHYGGTTKDNCVPACHGCNGVKMAWHPDRIPYTTKRNSKNLQAGIVRVKEYLKSLREAKSNEQAH